MALHMTDDGVAAAYASALHSLASATGAHCVSQTLQPPDEVPGLDVDGLESPIAWPLYTDERDVLMELFHGDDHACVVVPSAQATFSDDMDEPLLDAIAHDVRKRLGIRSAFSAELSHLVLESSGVTSTSHLLARNPSESSFGTLLLLAPAIDRHAGGDVTVTGARDAITWSTSAEHMRWSYCAFLNTSSVTMTSLSDGHRALLVFDLVYDAAEPGTNHSLSVHDALLSAARCPRQRYTAALYSCSHRPTTPLSFDALRSADRAFLHAVLATSAFDVALVRATPSLDDAFDAYLLGDDDMPIEIAEALFVPDADVPTAVQRAFCQAPLVGLAVNESRRRSPDYLVLWPKQHRWRIRGFQATLTALQSSVPSEVDAIALAAIDAFAAIDVVHTHPFDLPSPTTLGAALVALNRLPLIQAFLRDAVDLSDVYYFDAMVHWITHVLQTYGWPQLYDALLHLLSRAGATWCGAAKGAELLSHLATSLRTQPFARECLLESWHALLQALLSMPEAPLTPTSVPPALLTHGLVLEASFHSTSETVETSWLGAKLPPSLVRHVDAYRASTLETLLATYPTAFHPIRGVALAIDPLLPATRSDDTSLHLRPWLRNVFATFPSCLDRLHGILDDAVLAALVRVARAANALPLLLQHAQSWLGRFVLPALVQLLDDPPTLALIRDPLLTLVNAFLAEDQDPDLDGDDEMRENPPDVIEMLLRDELAVLRAMLLLLRRLDGPLDVWRRALTSHRQLHDVAFARYVLVPLHELVHDDDIDLAAWLATLARPVLQRHLANEVLPNRPNWSITSVQLPCDCVQCSAITAFLSDATRSLLRLPQQGLCPLYGAAEKLLLPAGVAIDDSPTGSHVVLLKPRHWTFYEHALDEAGLAALDDDDRHAAKRQRRLSPRSA
ncbi:hypothetical protein SDRG_09696 [Saprolegnia diclina VS20]|uniref:Uncharacterized protein n=1 Tax=Saprolegnia diclina (strain VS20) TaxID=1156394 RepID=T0QGG7_SAPDV|nr:hypothetical protein SDRG_09696 [Saprolegnia diclina VS20]EQC32725.1 hypothetical protein SDRG_09696 [Saprolegnia diclina VS20]|eukprot:XP_008613869.1 hypothetical protein SDRG_09696 [Saprolegnia diclina VS20]